MKRNTDPEFVDLNPDPLTGFGDLIALVPLAGQKDPAVLDAGDYWHLTETLNVSPVWFYSPAAPTRKYVCLKTDDGRLMPVARLIVGAQRGQVVRYRDGNHLNLRRDNLMIARGPAKSDCTEEALRPLPLDKDGRVAQSYW